MSKLYSIDCEMIGDKEGNSMVARISVVDSSLNVVFNEYVKPTNEVGDYRTTFSGIRRGYEHTAKPLQTIKEQLIRMLAGSTLVGHDIKNDLDCLGIHHQDVRDLTTYEHFRRKCGHKPSLKELALTELNARIQEGEHDSVEDAKAAMRIYLKYRF